MGYLPTMKTTQDKAKLIATIILLVLSVVFNDQFEGQSEELVTALSVLIAYLIGLYSETYQRKDDNQDE